MSYQVKLNVFEGPFDLLVYLIEKARMNIYDIQIAKITQQYLFHVEKMKEEDPDHVGEFMVLAATLIEIKSRMLLPGEKELEEELEMEDPRKNLVERILEYKQFKQAAELFGEWEEENANRIYKPQEELEEYDQNPEQEIIQVDLSQFFNHFQLFLEKRQKIAQIQSRYDTRKLEREKISVERQSERIRHLIKEKKQIKFSELELECDSRYEVAVTFLAMLQMMKRGKILVKQKVNFGEIFLQVITRESRKKSIGQEN